MEGSLSTHVQMVNIIYVLARAWQSGVELLNKTLCGNNTLSLWAEVAISSSLS